MANFLNPIFLNTNIRQQKFVEKIKIDRTDVSLQFLLGNNATDTYRVVYIVNLNPGIRLKDPSITLSPRNINMESLRNAIIANIRPYDKKYMVLKTFDTRKAEFHLDTDKWFKDATTGLNPKTHYSKFDRAFKLKIAPPRMILQDFIRKYWGEFVIKQFKKWLEVQKKEAKFFKYLIPENLRSKIRQKIRNMFDWQYDIQSNTIVAKLKPIWILALVYATGSAFRKINKSDLKNRNKKEMFSVKVKKNIKSFDKKKWEKFISKRGFI